MRQFMLRQSVRRMRLLVLDLEFQKLLSNSRTFTCHNAIVPSGWDIFEYCHIIFHPGL